MRRVIYQLHLFLGLAVSVPVLAWALSGFLYALPNMVEGVSVEKIDAGRVRITPGEAMARVNGLAGEILPTTALTLLMKDGRPQYQSIGGLGAESIYIDAASGEASFSKPPGWKTRFFPRPFLTTHRHLAGGFLLIFSALAALSSLHGHLPEHLLLDTQAYPQACAPGRWPQRRPAE